MIHLRRLLCRWLRLVPSEDVEEAPGEPESLWGDLGDLWDARSHRAVWPRIVTSDTWRMELEPWFRQVLLATFVSLAKEQDERRIIRLQERAALLNEFLETPRLAMARTDAALENARKKGDYGRFDRMMQQAQATGHVTIPMAEPDERAERAQAR